MGMWSWAKLRLTVAGETPACALAATLVRPRTALTAQPLGQTVHSPSPLAFSDRLSQLLFHSSIRESQSQSFYGIPDLAHRDSERRRAGVGGASGGYLLYAGPDWGEGGQGLSQETFGHRENQQGQTQVERECHPLERPFLPARQLPSRAHSRCYP